MSAKTIEGFRLSPQQRHLWQLQAAEDDGRGYRTQGSILLEGVLDVGRLEAALEQIVSRHEIFYTSFQSLPGMKVPLQVVQAPVPLKIELVNWRGLDSAEQQEQLRRLLDQMAAGREQHQNGQVVSLSVALAALGDNQHMLLVDMPAMYGDGVSLESFLSTLAHDYAGQGELDEPMQYIDLSEWQNDLLVDEETAVGRDYWLAEAQQGGQELRLPFTIRPKASTPFALRTFSRAVSPDITRQAEALARQAGVPNWVVWLAGWPLLLSRLSGQEKVVVGVEYDGRKYDELKDVLGLLARHLPIHSSLCSSHSLADLLIDLKTVTEEAHKWQEVFTWEQIAGDNGQAVPFFPYCFGFVEEQPAEQAGGLTFRLQRRQTIFDRFALKLVCEAAPGAMQTTWMYDGNCFNDESVERLAEQYLTVMKQVLSEPGMPLGAVNPLTTAEREQIVVAWNQTATSYPDQQCFQELFEAQAARTPDNTAVILGDESLAYRELNRRANQVAHHLRELGVGPEVRVAVFMERSFEFLIGLLGILKAGGAYLPLDHNYPVKRLQFMLQDAGVSVLLTQSAVAAKLPDHDAQVVTLDADWSLFTNGLEGNPAVRVTPDNLAYVIYTSGSTGQPKGVMCSHSGLVNYLYWTNRTLFDEQTHHIPVITQLAFDASLKQLFAPLLAGRSVWLVEAETVMQPMALWSTLQSQSGVCFNCVPSLWRALLYSMEGLMNGGPIKRLLVGGEALSADLVRDTFERVPEIQIWNLYGPSEATANAGAAPIQSPDNITIGRPLDNMQLYILDQHHRPVPIGVPGELCIGGVGIARGYLARPGLTADRFIPHPFSNQPGARLYRSGDLARFQPDGNIEYLGRIDHQVKVRGFRIELGEIEATLREHAGIQDCAVTAYEKTSTDTRLVAYLVFKSDTVPSLNQLKRFLAQELPDYMVPSSFIVLEKLPLTASGKLDRQALPTPEQAESTQKRPYVAPGTPVEEVLAGLWAELLEKEPVGVNDDFFMLGGDSILSIRAVSRLRSIFQVEIPIRALFDAPTVGQFAQAITAYENVPGQIERAAVLLKQIEEMSDEDIEAALSKKKQGITV